MRGGYPVERMSMVTRPCRCEEMGFGSFAWVASRIMNMQSRFVFSSLELSFLGFFSDRVGFSVYRNWVFIYSYAPKFGIGKRFQL